MFKAFAAIAIAACVAGLATLASMSMGRVVADPLPQREAAAMHMCSQRAWPYSNCAGTRFNTRVRLVTTDRLQ
jgi:hypothetical protein